MLSEVAVTNVFEAQCEEIAHRFVQTMVFMDDQAGYESPITLDQETVTPPRGITGRAPLKKNYEDIANSDNQSGGTESHPLNVADLMASSMKNGLVCSVHKPQTEEDFDLANLKALLTADIVCFDWIMKNGDNGSTALGLIEGVIREDLKIRGRHRLIAIYTYRPDLRSILESIQSRLSESVAQCELNLDQMSLTGSHFRIVGLLKEGGTQLKEWQVSAKELPDRLISEFSQFNRGLIPSLTMASIAVLRESTGHLLAKLNNQLDGPFLAHKSLIPTPAEATDYASSIIASELGAVIHKHRMADKLLSDEAIRSFIQAQDSTVLKYLGTDDEEARIEVDVDTLCRFIFGGLRKIDDDELGYLIAGGDENGGKNGILARSLASFLTDTYKSTCSNNLEFLRVANIAADDTSPVYLDEEEGGHGKLPILTFGSIIKIDETYLLCLQPSCDSIRLGSSGSPFWFIKLNKNNERPTLVVSVEGSLVGLRYSARVGCSKLIEFNRTDNASGTVTAERDNDGLVFKGKGNNPKIYRWISELKPDIARKIGQELANQYIRIGLDEFELSRTGWGFP